MFVNCNGERTLKILCQTLKINSDKENTVILLRAREIKNVNLFKEIINSNNLNLNQFASIELTKTIINTMPSELNDKEKHLSDLECLKLLFKSKHVDVSGVDRNGIPLLSYAADERREKVVMELLNHGAYLGMRSNYRKNPMTHIRPKILEEYLNSCITIDEEESPNKNISINLKTFAIHPLGSQKNCSQ